MKRKNEKKEEIKKEEEIWLMIRQRLYEQIWFTDHLLESNLDGDILERKLNGRPYFQRGSYCSPRLRTCFR